MPEYEPSSWPPEDAPTREWNRATVRAHRSVERRLNEGESRMQRIDDTLEALSGTVKDTNDTVTRIEYGLLGDPRVHSKGTLQEMRDQITSQNDRLTVVEGTVADIHTTIIKWAAIIGTATALITLFGPTLIDKIWP